MQENIGNAIYLDDLDKVSPERPMQEGKDRNEKSPAFSLARRIMESNKLLLDLQALKKDKWGFDPLLESSTPSKLYSFEIHKDIFLTKPRIYRGIKHTWVKLSHLESFTLKFTEYIVYHFFIVWSEFYIVKFVPEWFVIAITNKVLLKALWHLDAGGAHRSRGCAESRSTFALFSKHSLFEFSRKIVII